MARATNSIEYIEMFCVPHSSTISFITKDIGNNGFFVVYKNWNGKTRHTYVSKNDIIEYMTRYEKHTYSYNNRKRKLIALQIMSE